MNNEYLTIKEFAKQAGVSTQYVYKQIRDGKLKKYTETVDGKKVLKPEALEKIGKQKGSNKNPTDEQSIVSFLQEQLKEKDRQIAEFQNALARSQELLRTEQNIRYATERRILLLEERLGAKAEETTDEATEAVTGDSGAVTEAPGGEDPEQEQNEGRRVSDQTGGGSETEQTEQTSQNPIASGVETRQEAEQISRNATTSGVGIQHDSQNPTGQPVGKGMKTLWKQFWKNVRG